MAREGRSLEWALLPSPDGGLIRLASDPSRGRRLEFGEQCCVDRPDAAGPCCSRRRWAIVGARFPCGGMVGPLYAAWTVAAARLRFCTDRSDRNSYPCESWSLVRLLAAGRL